jgi:hypothetical protein
MSGSLEVVTVTNGDDSHLDDQQIDQLKLDYQQTNMYITMLANSRLLPLTLLPALTAAAITILTRFDNPRTVIALGLLGFFISFGLILHDMHIAAQHSAAVYRAESIERLLKLPAFKEKQVGGLFNETPKHIVLTQPESSKKPFRLRHRNFISLIYGVVIGGWVHVFVHAFIRTLPSGWQPSEVATDLGSTVLAAAVAVLATWRLTRIIEHNEAE